MAGRPPASAPRAISAEDVVSDGADALARGDLAAYRDVHGQARDIEGVQARYRARVRLLEQGLEAARAADADALPRLHLTLAAASVDALEDEPREPLLLNYAGVAFTELWALRTAQALFKAAGRLDSELPPVQRNLSELGRRRRANGPPPGLPAAVVAELRPWCPRAERVAARAKPAEGLSLSLCMVVRNEEQRLPRCLVAAREAVDEIIVVDTGSVDRTREIAASHGARVLDVAANGAPLTARNASLDAATGDWALCLDPGEFLAEGHAARLRGLTGKTWREAFYLVEADFTGRLASRAVTRPALRMFRNRPEYRFTSGAHDPIGPAVHALPERLETTPVRFERHGHLTPTRDVEERSRRSVELLGRTMAKLEARGAARGRPWTVR
jgi:glycosyl transferase family 2